MMHAAGEVHGTRGSVYATISNWPPLHVPSYTQRERGGSSAARWGALVSLCGRGGVHSTLGLRDRGLSVMVGCPSRQKLAVPRLPLPDCVGRREAWLSFDPWVLREWAMTPLVLSLGLDAPCALESSRIPRRRTVESITQEDGTIPRDAVCVGQGIICSGARRPGGRHPWWQGTTARSTSSFL